MVRITIALSAAAALLGAQTQDFGAPGRYGSDYRVEDIPGTTETMTGSRIYFPDSAGSFPNGAVPAAVVVFGHGWQMGIDRYYSYAQHLASWGYIVCLPTISNPLINPEHDKRARLMVDAARWTAARDTVPGDRFFGRLDRWNWGFAGHSMGGGLSLLAADLFGLADTLRCAVAIHSPQTDPATRSVNVLVPKLVLAGGVDNIAPWRDVRQAYWDSAPAPGTFAVIGGANHGYVMDFSYFWENGGTSQITRDTHQLIIRRHLTAYFERFLQGDESDWNFGYCFGDSIKGHRTMDSVEVRLPPVAVAEPAGSTPPGLAVAANPSSGRVVVRYRVAAPGPVELAVYDARGRRVARLASGPRPSGAHRADWAGTDSGGRAVPAGAYFVTITATGGRAALPVTILR